MQYNTKLDRYDLHVMLDENDVQMVNALVEALPGRKQEKKATRAIRQAIRLAYAAQFGDTDPKP